jgi:hypothetical protein
VGASKADSNQARTAGENGASGSAARMVVVTGREILLRPYDFDRMFETAGSQMDRAGRSRPEGPDGTSAGANFDRC